MKNNTTNQFLIGSWVSFYPFDVHSYEYQLDQMAEAGLNFNIFPAVFGGGMLDAETWNNVEKQYEARNMYYCMNGGLREDMLCEGVEYARGKKRCIGYHLIDEPGAAALANVGRFVRAYRAADPTRYPFVNLFPSYVGTAVMEGDYYQYCSRFVREAGVENIEYLSHDYYPFHLNGTALSIFGDMEVIRRVAFENHRLRTHAFPQSTAWNGTRMPNADEMRWNVYAYLAYGFKALSWFNLVCPGKSDTEGEGFRDSIIYRDGTVRDKKLLREFGKINYEARTLGDTLMKLDTVHAYHTRDGIAGVELLPRDWMITPVEDGDFVISHMVTANGDETYVMIFNNSFVHPTTAAFRISEFSGIESLTYISPFNGNEYPVSVNDGVFTETFRTGEGKLYKLGGKLSRRVLPLDRTHTRLDLELASATSVAGIEVSFPMHNGGEPVSLQLCTNKKFTEDKTVIRSFEAVPASGRLYIDPIRAKYIRLSVDSSDDAPDYGYAELRVRFAEEESLPAAADCEAKITEINTTLIPLGTSVTGAAALLPTVVTAVYETGDTLSLTPTWDIGVLDTTVSGSRQIPGSVSLPDGSVRRVYAPITVTYEVDYTDLDQAISVVDELVSEEYSAESWKAVQEYYDAAVAMKDGSYPQNAVTVAAWQLLERVRELEPVQWTMPEPVVHEDRRLHVTKGVLPTAVAALAGTVVGAVAGIFAARRKKKK